MATFVLIHGAGDTGWYWHLVEAELRERGHDTVAVGHGDYTGEIAWFYQDVAPGLAAEALGHGREQSEARFGEPSPMTAWPELPIHVIACRDDRIFPLEYLRRVSEERLGITPDELDGGHTPALSRPRELAELLDAYATQAAVG